MKKKLVMREMHALRLMKILKQFVIRKEKLQAVEPGNDVILHTVSISKLPHDNMKIGAIQLDVPIVVYRSINIIDNEAKTYIRLDEYGNEGFNSTTYYKSYAIKYATGFWRAPELTYVDKLLDSGENEVLDYTDQYQGVIILKITIPSRNNVNHTDVCGKGETELTLLNSGSLNFISKVL